MSSRLLRPAGKPLQFGHVFIVLEENASYADFIGSSSMPYFDSLANTYGLATNYYANLHPSIPNYFELTAGKTLTSSTAKRHNPSQSRTTT